jgi:hypothetical protein
MRSRGVSAALGVLGVAPVALTVLASSLVGSLFLASCSTQKAEAPRVCCDQPKIPAGIPAFTVVKDDVTGPTDGQDVRMRVALKQRTKRDDIYKSLQFLYRYAMTRHTFEPTNFVGEFYNSEGEAQAGGTPVAKIWRERSDKGPKCDNSIKLDFPEQVEKAFQYSLNRAVPEDLQDTCHLAEKKKVERFDDKFAKKPTYKIDPATQAAEVNFPYLESGKDEYVEKLNFNSAMTYWAEFTSTMFNKAPDLKQLTYIGVLNDEPVLKITVNREEYDSKLSTVQETIAAYAAVTFAKLGLHKTNDKGALKEQEAHKTKTYKAALSFVPRDRVFISPKLKMSS